MNAYSTKLHNKQQILRNAKVHTLELHDIELQHTHTHTP